MIPDKEGITKRRLLHLSPPQMYFEMIKSHFFTNYYQFDFEFTLR